MESIAWLPSDEMTEAERVDRWRAQALTEAGYPTVAALELAGRRDVDLYRAVGLLQHGCDPVVAIDILL